MDNNLGRVFLVDTESIKDYSFARLVNLTECDTVYFFKSNNSKSMDLNNMEELIRSKCKVDYIDAKVTSYGLVTSYISLFIGSIMEFCKDKIVVVSSDDLFENLIELIKGSCDITLLSPSKIEELKEGNRACDDYESVEIPNFASFNSKTVNSVNKDVEDCSMDGDDHNTPSSEEPSQEDDRKDSVEDSTKEPVRVPVEESIDETILQSYMSQFKSEESFGIPMPVVG